MTIGEITAWLQLIFWTGAAIRYVWKRWRAEDIAMLFKKLYHIWLPDRFLATLIILGLLSSTFLLYSFYKRPIWILPPKVYESFMPLYKEYEKELSHPLNNVNIEPAVYESFHEHGIVLWLQTFRRFYVLDDNGKWKDYRESFVSTDPKWTNSKWLTEYFRPPKDLYPPYTGVAQLFDKHKELLKQIGFRKKEHCFFQNIYYQEFKSGKIIGSLPNNPALPDSMLFAIIGKDSGDWQIRESEILKAPKCKSPG